MNEKETTQEKKTDVRNVEKVTCNVAMCTNLKEDHDEFSNNDCM